MKNFILTLVAITALTSIVPAKSRDTFKFRGGQQKTIVRGELTVKFVSVTEDSRCPAGVQCVWAGNARINLKVSDANGRSKVLEINTTMGAQGDQFGGYAINLISLSQPGGKSKGGASRYIATLSIKRLTR